MRMKKISLSAKIYKIRQQRLNNTQLITILRQLLNNHLILRLKLLKMQAI
jgi:hypothetical protein